MCKCNYCRAEFDEPVEENVYLGECFGFPQYEKQGFCPCCRSGDWEEEEEDYDEEEN